MEIKCALDDIIKMMSRAVDIIRKVRAMFQRGEAEMKTVDVKKLLFDVQRVVSADARMKRISWSMDLPDSLPGVRGNKTRLTQVVLNLVSNAFDSVSE